MFGRFRVVPRPLVQFSAAVIISVTTSFGAAAQVLDTYFPPIGASVGGTPSDSSQVRVASEYDPLGIRVGDFIIRPNLSQTFGYDTNVDGILGGRASAVLSSQAAISAQSDWTSSSVYSALSVSHNSYTEAPARDETDWTATLGGTHDFGRGKLGAVYSHLDLVQTNLDIGTLATQTKLVPYHVNSFATSYTTSPLGPFVLIPNISVTRYDFDSVSQATGVATSNRLVLQEGVTLQYELAPKRTVLLVTRATQIRYDADLASIGSQNSNGFGILGGLQYDTDGPFSFRALAGYQQRDYANAALQALSAPIAEVSVNWTPNRRTSLDLTILRDIEDSADATLGGFTYSAVRLRASSEVRRNLVLVAFGEVQYAEFGTIGRLPRPGAQTIYNFGVNGSLKLNRNVRLTTSYGHSIQESGAPNNVGGYGRDIILVGFAFAL